MPNYNKEHAKGAVSSGSFLIVLLKMAGSPDETLEKAYLALTDALNVLGVDIKLDELKRLDKFTREEAGQIVKNLRSRITSAIERSYGPTVSAWFELSSALSLIATTSTASERTGLISTAEEDLKSAAMRAGYAESKLDNILYRLQTDDPFESPGAVIKHFMEEAFEIIETPRLFISYATVDHELAEEIADLCRRANIYTFVANINIPPGTDWYDRLGDEIRQADELLVIISPESIDSAWVMIEVGAAWALGKGIIPAVLYEDIGSLPEPIKRFQAQKIISKTERKNLVKKIAQRMHNRANLSKISERFVSR